MIESATIDGMNTTQERNLLQEVVMWIVGIVAAFLVALAWAAVERVTGFALDYKNAMGLFIVSLGGGWFVMSKVRNTEIGVIRKGIIYGAIVGVWFVFASSALIHVSL